MIGHLVAPVLATFGTVAAVCGLLILKSGDSGDDPAGARTLLSFAFGFIATVLFAAALIAWVI